MVQEPLTWGQFLNITNTGLIAMVIFLLREAWKSVHRRMDTMEAQHGDMRERVSSLEAFRGWTNPHRRRSDPQPE